MSECFIHLYLHWPRNDVCGRSTNDVYLQCFSNNRVEVVLIVLTKLQPSLVSPFTLAKIYDPPEADSRKLCIRCIIVIYQVMKPNATWLAYLEQVHRFKHP